MIIKYKLWKLVRAIFFKLPMLIKFQPTNSLSYIHIVTCKTACKVKGNQTFEIQKFWVIEVWIMEP